MIKKRMIFAFLMAIGIFCSIGIILWLRDHLTLPSNTIKIGILHSLSGDLAISEQPVADAALMAVKEINLAGGILGKKIEAIVVDGKSNETIFAQEAERLITTEKVAAIFGCWTSRSRIMVKEIVEKYDSLLFYPVQFEGLEASPNIVYTGTTPNQQIIPGVTWCIQHLGKRFFLVGSDNILHEIIKDVVYAHDGKIVGTEYLSQHNKNIAPVIQKIIAAKPDVILNNTEGDANILFFNALREEGITPEKIPTMSFSISEPELQQFNINSMTGDYATWSYFESIDNRENRIFIAKIKALYGQNETVSDAMDAAYFGVYLWKQAAEKADSVATIPMRKALANQAFNSPQGIIHIAQQSLHTWSHARIGKIRSDKQFSILWSSQKSIQPMAYPPTRSINEWNSTATNIRNFESTQ
jgi:urea transport system substrate-binding protein